MQRWIRSTRAGSLLAILLVFALSGRARSADTQEAQAILDRAIQALGGEGRLSKVTAASWTATGTLTVTGTDHKVTIRSVAQGFDHLRQELEGVFGGNTVKGVTVVAGDKGWRHFGANHAEMDQNAVSNEKRRLFLTLIPITLLPLKGKEFKLEAVGEKNIDGKPAVGIKASQPDEDAITLYFDKGSGLPVKMEATVAGFMGNEYLQETTFSDYREMGGIQKATKIVIKRDNAKLLSEQITEFTVLGTVDPKTFAEP